MKRMWIIVALALAACTTTPTPPPTSQPTTARPPVFRSVTVTGLGTIRRGASSGLTLILTFDEASVGAIARGPGSFRVTLSDQAGSSSTVSFVGAPSTASSPGSLGASATIGSNVLTVEILDADPLNIEPIIVTGIGIAAASTAALGSIGATMDGFSGSLAGGATDDHLLSPGSVVGSP